MAGANFTFNLGPVVDVSARNANSAPAATESHFGTAARFQNVQAHSAQPATTAYSPACDGSSCVIVHGEGPGVTTLSIGEEDGAGDYLSRPIVDGSDFMQPPVISFASAGDMDVTTLAIGEEDGGYASAPVQAHAAFESPLIGPAHHQATMQPIYSPADAKGHSAPVSISSAGTVAAGPEMAEAAYIQPRAKPITFALDGSPVPGAKPSVNSLASTVPPATETTAMQGNYVSVGSYDSYVAGLETTETLSPVPASASTSEEAYNADLVAPQPVAEPAIAEDTVKPASAETATATTESAEPTPVYTLEETAQPATSIDTVESAEPASAPAASGTTESAEPTPVAVKETADPAGMLDGKPFSFDFSLTSPPAKPEAGTADPAVSAQESRTEAETVAVTQPEPVYEMNFAAPKATPEASRATSFSVEAPIPDVKPDAGNGAPILTEEDYRITTLALGEEEAGGG